MNVKRTAIVVPALDAASSVADVVTAALQILPDVVVVDDGSVDDTGARARAAGARLISHPRNLGKGAALRTAFEELLSEPFDALITMDADGQHLASEIPKLLAVDADLVLGVRSESFGEMSALRRHSNRLSTRAIAAFAGRPLLDAQTGFRCYSRRLIESVGLPEHRFDAESAVIVRASRGGFSIAEVPVELRFADGRSVSHYRGLVDSLRIARSVVRAWGGAVISGRTSRRWETRT